MRHSLCWLVLAAPLIATAADGDLDPTFGGGGKVRLPQAGGYHGTWMPTDVAVQSTGKVIISGWNDQGATNCFVLRLNANGTLDTTFGGGNGFQPGYAGYTFCKYTSVVVRGSDSIVAGGYGVGYTVTPGFVAQFTPGGAPDTSFASDGTADLSVLGTNDKGVEINRIVLDANGGIVAAGVNNDVNGNNAFYVAHVSASGKDISAYGHLFPAGSSYSDIAYDLATASDGSYYLAGTATSVAGDLDCAVAHMYFDSGLDRFFDDNTFAGNTSSSLVLARNYGSDNNDYCFGIALQPLDTLVLGGQSTAVYLTVNFQIATSTSQGADGSPGTRTDHSLWYDQSSAPVNGEVDTVRRVVVEPYDKRFLLIGSGPNHTSSPSTGYDIGVVRYSGPSTSDGSFGTNGFALYDVGSTITTPNINTATSAVLWHGRLIIVGTAQDGAGGTDIVALRLKPFDGIFKDGFEG